MKRKTYKTTLLFIILIFTLPLVSACGKEKSAQAANELSFSLEDISDLTISYDDENVSFFTSKNDNLIIREYMSKDKNSFHAKVSQNKDSIRISEGKKPFFKGKFTRYVEVYLPDSYSENLKVTTTDGNIDMSGVELELNSIYVDCVSGTFSVNRAVAEDIYFSSTNGELELGDVVGDQIKIETTQGNVICEKIDGNVDYTSTSGNAEFKSAVGSGAYRANNSGILSVVYDEVTGDLSFFNKNDDIQLQFPGDQSFIFEGITTNGKIDTDFQDNISVKGDMTSGVVGSNPTVTIKVETKNGNIEVRLTPR